MSLQSIAALSRELGSNPDYVLSGGGNTSFKCDKYLYIKPSGVPYEELKPEDMVVIDLEGNKVEGDLNPSSDTDTHMVFYREFPEIGGVAHTHSTFAVSFAQAACDIPAYGTTHADFAFGSIPCTRLSGMSMSGGS